MKTVVDDNIASADLLNPSDALEFLAHVADRAGGNQLPPIINANMRPAQRSSSSAILRDDNRQTNGQGSSNGNVIQYPPLIQGRVTVDMIHELLVRYEERYHPYFPIANPAAMDPHNLPSIAVEEPHLLSAILTVASKDEREWWQIHEACSAHMQQLISTLVYCGDGTVEAVEALLILAEWVPRRPHSTPAIGRGEEDHAAWMHVGTAIRLGYLLGLDRAGFRNENETTLSVELNRRRLAWAACYMSDRQISVRIGKAFWSRGPGPSTGLRAHDFPSLRPRNGHGDDFAAIFQANLELTQLFSNAHDVLYSSKSRSHQLHLGGEYVKYIDDFRVAIRTWHSTWGTLSCSPHLKASLILSYEYLRLYINAFAYQATLNRIVLAQASNATTSALPTSSAAPTQHTTPSRGSATAPFTFTDVAAAPDARFIYDSIDAAKALLSTFNSFIDPVTCFRFMPLRFYLYVIWCACFLYKARETGVMGNDARGGVRRMVNDAVDRLQKASACANDVGDRYSRLIRLLWRKPPAYQSGNIGSAATGGADITRPGTAQVPPGSAPTVTFNGADNTHGQVPGQPAHPEGLHPMQQQHQQHHRTSINAFSWLDLEAVGDY
ncbi:hypothetical protein LTR66_010544, partial [Elasticomyces elasticus]